MVVDRIKVPNGTKGIWIDAYGDVVTSNPGWSDTGTYVSRNLKTNISEIIFSLALDRMCKSHDFGKIVCVTTEDSTCGAIFKVDYEDPMPGESSCDIEEHGIFKLIKMSDHIVFLAYSSTENDVRYFYHGVQSGDNQLYLSRVSEHALLRKYSTVKNFNI